MARSLTLTIPDAEEAIIERACGDQNFDEFCRQAWADQIAKWREQQEIEDRHDLYAALQAAKPEDVAAVKETLKLDAVRSARLGRDRIGAARLPA